MSTLLKTPVVLLSGRAYAGKDTAAAVIAAQLGGVVVSLADPIKRFLADPEGYGLTAEQLWGREKEKPFSRRDVSLGVLVQLAEAHFGLADVDLVEAFEDALDQWREGLPTATTARHMMQTLGTNCVREKIEDDFWIDYGLEVANDLLVSGGGYERESGVVESEGFPGVVVVPDGRFRNEVLPVLAMGGAALRVDRPHAELSITGASAAHASEQQQNTIPRWWFTDVLLNDSSLENFQARLRHWCHLVSGSATVAR